jgi:kinesin family protein 5
VELQQRYTDQEERLKSDLAAHIEQVESKNAEVERLKGTIDEYKVSIEELNRALTAVSTGNNDGQYLASTIQEYDRLRRNNEAQYHEFENIKRNLMADLSNRCEKVFQPFLVAVERADDQVVELEMKLNEISEQYKVVAKSANSRAQQRKLEALEYNLERLSTVQQQVSLFLEAYTDR